MKKSFVFAAALALCFSASATVFGNTDNSVRPVANADASAQAAAHANAAAVAAQQQAQQQGQLQGQIATGGAGGKGGAGGAGGLGGAGGSSDATGGAGGAATGGAGGDSGGNTFRGGDMTVERSAPGVVVGNQTQPIIDCRRTLGLGGSNTSGAVVASGIPLWKEGDCSGVMGIVAMGKTPPGTFTVADFKAVACTIEVIAATPGCKAERQRAADASRPVAYYGN